MGLLCGGFLTASFGLGEFGDDTDAHGLEACLSGLEVFYSCELLFDDANTDDVACCADVGQRIHVDTDDVEERRDGGCDHAEHGGTPS